MKVYCKGCKYLKDIEGPGISINKCDCNYTGNILKYDGTNWYEEKERIRFANKPSDINQHNTCQWYVKKE